MREVQYALRTLEPPPPVPGEPRGYAPEQRDLVVEWLDAFHAEAGLLVRPDPARSLANRLATGGEMWLWWVEDRPVCLVGSSAPVAGVPRIGPVWTPPEHRRRGFAAALTAHACRSAFAAGAVACTLYADAANETSNGVYRRLGFTPVGTAVEAELTH
jgi:predicted GNAT family acetyltransferase